jgi:hypothetical protein
MYNESDDARPEVIRGNVIEVKVREPDNITILRVVDVNGEIHDDVETIAPGSGGDDSFVLTPYTIGQQVMLLKTSVNDPVYCLGGTFKPSRINVHNAIFPSHPSEDRRGFTTSDYVIANKGSSINISGGYGIVCTSVNDMRCQLADNGMLRISAGGKCTDVAINGGKFITKMHETTNEMRDKIVETEVGLGHHYDWILDLTNQLITLTGAMIADPGLQAAAPATITAATTMNTALTSYYQSFIPDSFQSKTALAQLPLKTTAQSKLDTGTALNTKIRLP